MIDPGTATLLSGGISSATSLLGGFLSRPDLSERDLMYEQEKLRRSGVEWNNTIGRKLEVRGLKSAGINPMLPYIKGNISQPAVNPSIPGRMLDPVGEGISKAGATAVQAARMYYELERMKEETRNIKETNRQIRATTNNIAANTDYTSARAASERENLGLIQMQQELTTARTASERQSLQRSIVETAIAKENLTMAEKDAVVAAIDIDMYESSVGEVSRWLQNLGINPKAAVGMAHMLWSFMRTKRSK